MATVIFKEDHPPLAKKGETKSVPFILARELEALGKAQRPPQSSPKARPIDQQAAIDSAAEIRELRAQVATLRETVAKNQQIENEAISKAEADAKSAMDLADRATAENEQLKKQLAELQKKK